MTSSAYSYGGSQITFLMPPTPGVAGTEPAGHATAPRNGGNDRPQILTFALQQRPRATRASAHKVRTGCITSDQTIIIGKRRHVKCDEVKPSCQRCVKWQGFCEGYDSPNGSSASTPGGPESDADNSKTTSLVSVSKKHKKKTLAANHRSRPPSHLRDVSLPTEPTENLFGNVFERQYFDYWLSRRYRLGGGFFDEQLWNETIPQMSHQHASVRYAAMAVGGIGKALLHSLKPTTPAQLGANGPHYGLALSYYGRAIREVRKATRDTSSLRAAIVCCLLFVCFEVLHGDRKAAFALINSGQTMMDELLRRCEEERRRDQSIIGAEAVETEALHVFQRLIQQSWSCGVLRRRERYGQGHLVEDNKDFYSSESWCCQGGSGRKCAIHKMPVTFTSLQEARRWWDVTQHYVTHSSDIVCRVTQLGLSDDFLSECNERIRRQLEESVRAKAGDVDESSSSSAAAGAAAGAGETASRWQDFRDALARWESGFEPLWTAALTKKTSDERSYTQAAHLRAQYLTLSNCLESPLGCSYDRVAQLTPRFREIIQLCAGLLAYQKRSFVGGEIFTMDMGPTWPLFVAGTRCRVPELRNEAIRLLRENPRRDGLWDSRFFYALMVRNRLLEISNSREGTPEEQWWRLQHRSACIDEQGALIAKAMDKNPLTGTWEVGEDNVRRFLFD
ncbi:hypothetical protein CORC01_13229 [Colletotrichum orchidophilum]|uniref:Zn(2)-C6 fungal-type domain-containing protein n=1 Tax=Colletotrichum orchidophilum TaxID=1209926 RepID=A0A1G4AQK3_9PEZI|nr:uncharacterized protein CORC01_13229 [Colletotrichum orchidophilum]OHE91457.1 hypothetical protein CORC01_13229 [Colletotrichum orchidophilum]